MLKGGIGGVGNGALTGVTMKAFEYSAISIPLALALLAGSPAITTASTVGLDINTFQTIASGHAAELKCKSLSRKEREELATHAAFAETAAVRTNGSGAVMAARSRAKSSANCGSAKQTASAGLAAGRRFEQSFVDNSKAQAKRAVKRKKAKQRVAAAQPKKKRQRWQQFASSSGGGLAGYTHRTRAYYVQRRCRHLAYGDDLRFWKIIAAQHRRLVRRFGSSAVSRAQARARSAASRIRCGYRSEQIVVAGLRGR